MLQRRDRRTSVTVLKEHRVNMGRNTLAYVLAVWLMCSLLQCEFTTAFDEVDVINAAGISGRTPGIRETKTPDGSRAFKMRPMERDLGTDQSTLERLLASMREDEGFMLITTFSQDSKNRGTIVSIDRSNGRTRGFGFHVDRRNDVAVVQYAEFGSGEPKENEVEFSPLNIEKSDNEMHTFVLDVRGNLVTLYMDCQLIGLKILPSSFYVDMPSDNMKLRLGKGVTGRNNVSDFKGTLATVKFAFHTSTNDVLVSQGCVIDLGFASSSQLSFASSYPIPSVEDSQPSQIGEAAMPGPESASGTNAASNTHSDSADASNSARPESNIPSHGVSFGSHSNDPNQGVMPPPLPYDPPFTPPLTNSDFVHPNAPPTDDTLKGMCALTCDQINNLNNQVQVLSEGYDEIWNQIEHIVSSFGNVVLRPNVFL